MSLSMISAFVLYLAVMVFIGWTYMKKNASSADFFLGGRKVGPWMTAFSAEASDMSGWLLMGLPGVAYLIGGFWEAFWTAVGLIIGTYLNWLLVAKRLRKYSIHSSDSITLPEFFTNRFKDRSRLIALVSVIFILFFFIIYTASGFVACAKLFSSCFQISYSWALILGIAVVLTYTLLGGYLAVCATDFIQGTIMLAALLISASGMVIALGGPEAAVLKIAEFGNSAVGAFGSDSPDNPLYAGTFSSMSIVSALAWGLGYFGMPHILVRFMGIRSNHEVKISRRIAICWVILALAAAVAVGIIGRAYLFPEYLTKSAAETVFAVSIQKLFPGFIAGIFLCGMLAAAMSTADSQLLVASSAFSRDIFKGWIKKDASEKTVLNVSRITVLAVAFIGFLLARDPNSSIFSLVSYAWAGFGATFGPIILLALFWRGLTRNGVLAGIIAGGVTVVVWHNLKGGIFDLYEILPGFIICGLVAVIISLLNKNKDPEVLKEFDEYMKLSD